MSEQLKTIEKKLGAAVEREKRLDVLKRFSIFASLVCAVILILILLEAAANFDSGARTALFWIFISGACSALFFYVLFPLLKDIIKYPHPDLIETSKKVGACYPEIKDELANVLQILKKNRYNHSDQLANAAFNDIYLKTENLDFNKIVDTAPAKKNFKVSLILLVASILAVAFVPGLSPASYRLINFGMNFTPPPKFIFEITPRSIEISKGDNVSIGIGTRGEQPAEIILSIKSEEQSEYSEKKLLPDSLGNFSYHVFSVKSSLEYFASSGNVRSYTYNISVVNRPIITDFEVTVFPPEYSRISIETQKDNGNISVLPGSKIKLTLNSSRPLSKAEIKFGDSAGIKMRVSSAKASVMFSAAKEAEYKMLIEDTKGFSNINPITYSIKLLRDAPPAIDILSPGENIKLGTEKNISLVSRISDDYGFTGMNLNYRIASSRYRQTSDEFVKRPITVSPQLKEEDVYFVWDLNQLLLAEGEVLSYYLEVFDNDNISGPKSAKTRQFTITIPSIDGLFSEAESRQEAASDDLRETLKEAEQLSREMQKISDDLKQNSKDLSWQEKERVEKAADKFKELGEKIDEVSQKLTKMKNDLAKNNLLSEETLKKYNELQELFEKMSSDEMKDAFKRMQDALKSLNRDNVQMSMDELKANEEYIRKSIERTLNLLKRIRVEQKVDELSKRTQELSEKIDELKEKTSQASLSEKPKREELTNRQKEITSDLKNLGGEMNKLDDLMNGMEDMPKDQLDKLQKEFEKQNNDNISEEASAELERQQKSEAIQNQQRLSHNMKNLDKQMQSMQSSMQQMNQTKTFYDMMKIMGDLLTLSKDQEKLKNDSELLSPYSNELNKNLREQSRIYTNLGKVLKNMSDLSQKTFAITPEMGKSLGRALSEMRQSMNSMQNNQGQPSAQMQRNAMGSLNEAAGLMKGAMDQMMNGGGSGGGMMSLMQQLQKLGNQQMSLNQMTQMLNSGQMSQQMMAEMGRLAQQQELIRKSLEQMSREAKESGQSKSIAGNLDKILGDMKEVVSNLESQKLNNDLLKQQEKILTKLLDAQRSMNERDFEKERKSESGKSSTRTTPPDLLLNTDEGKNKLKDELMRAVKERYKKDYEDLIRKYFKALEKEGR
ncbi:MAG: DUF4175 family protein [Melioribacteraceae bacterium]